MAKRKKKTARKKTAKKKTTTKKRKGSAKYNIINEIHEGVLELVEITRAGAPRIKRTELKELVEGTFEIAAKRAAGGERIRFPVIGALVRKDVKARKSGAGTNPFTGEPMKIKARAASKKPRWSFPKNLKVTFANKRYW